MKTTEPTGIAYIGAMLRDARRVDEMQQRRWPVWECWYAGSFTRRFEKAGSVGPLKPIAVSMVVVILARIGLIATGRQYQ